MQEIQYPCCKKYLCCTSHSFVSFHFRFTNHWHIRAKSLCKMKTRMSKVFDKEFTENCKNLQRGPLSSKCDDRSLLVEVIAICEPFSGLIQNCCHLYQSQIQISTSSSYQMSVNFPLFVNSNDFKPLFANSKTCLSSAEPIS